MSVDNILSHLALKNHRRLASLIGFKTLIAWHFIVLFTPLLAAPAPNASNNVVFARQLTLYLSLALCFLVLSFLKRKLPDLSNPRATIALHISVGALCVFVTAAAIAVSALDAIPVAYRLATVAALGCCEALSMHLWVHHLVDTVVSKRRRALAVDMIFGAVIAFFVLSLQQPLSFVIVAALPGLAAVSLLVICSSRHKQSGEARVVLPKQTQGILHRRFVKNHLPSVVFALTFGLMQGTYIETDTLFFLVSSPLILLGVIVSGLVVFLIGEKATSYEDIDTIHRYSLLFLILGVLGLSVFKGISPAYLSKATLLAGFVLFDFGALVLSMSMARRAGPAKAHLIDKGRAMVCFGLTLGLVLGFSLCRLIDESSTDTLVSAIGGAAVALPLITVLMRLSRVAPTESLLVEESAGATAISAVGPGIGDMTLTLDGGGSAALQKKTWQDACAEVARAYQLSPRETEVFMMLGKGRNAEYIQGKLVISLHTAKSHIANIYQKLGVHSIQEMLDLIELFAT